MSDSTAKKLCLILSIVILVLGWLFYRDVRESKKNIREFNEANQQLEERRTPLGTGPEKTREKESNGLPKSPFGITKNLRSETWKWDSGIADAVRVEGAGVGHFAEPLHGPIARAMFEEFPEDDRKFNVVVETGNDNEGKEMVVVAVWEKREIRDPRHQIDERLKEAVEKSRKGVKTYAFGFYDARPYFVFYLRD